MSSLTLASWNVNSLKVRLPQVLDWLQSTSTDALVLQETKMTDEVFPQAPLNEAGFDVVFVGQKTYNGVALITRKATVTTPTDVELNLPGYPDAQKRVVSATIAPVASPDKTLTFVGVYVPNGQVIGSPKFLYKMDWLSALEDFLKAKLAQNPRLVVGGDFNIAPHPADAYNPTLFESSILMTPPEIAAFEALTRLGLVDSFRAKHPEARDAYSWWDYQGRGFDRNHGVRIDHLLVSEPLLPGLTSATIDKEPRGWTQPSDHTPVMISLTL